MALTKLTFKESRKRKLDSVQKTLENFEVIAGPYGEMENIEKLLSINVKNGYFYGGTFDEYVEQIYGQTDDKEGDIEWKIAKILFLFSLAKILYSLKVNTIANESKKYAKTVFHNVKKHLVEALPDYQIIFETEKDFIEFAPTKFKAVTENMADIDSTIADPIKELLKNMKSDTELRGHINEVYGKLEKINTDNYKNQLNNNDLGILKDSLKLAKRIVNDSKDSAKGHEGKSNLSTRDVAHNFALLVSLIYKIKDKEGKPSA